MLLTEIEPDPSSDQIKASPHISALIPFSRDVDFVERGSMLDTIDQKRANPGSRTAPVGLGGIGKSQLAIEYAYRVRERSPTTWVFWVHASNAARFELSFRDIANCVQVPGRKDKDAAVFQLKVDTSKGNGQPLVSYLPHCPNGSILMTTRTKDAARKLVEDRDILTIDPMTKDEAAALLQKKLAIHDNDVSLSDLAAALEYMPLAIVQAAAYITQQAPRCSVQKYLDQYRENDRRKESLLSREGGQVRRDREAKNSIIVTWQISFEHIRQVKPSAADLLSFMSFFDRQGIPDVLLRTRRRNAASNFENPINMTKPVPSSRMRRRVTVNALGRVKNKRLRQRKAHHNRNDDNTDEENALQSNMDDTFEDDIAFLRDYSFISVNEDGKTFEMHRLVQLATRRWLTENDQLEQWERQFLQNLDTELPSG
ncbi:hypothetical protein BX600DRAFT_485071 [Xylariales sp. PMI_506]|nr:hypothetical protein BX600DRAFT_485071 [Xylariales sp. PMI_506]